MVKRLAGIIFIYLCAAVAWAILGSTVFLRSNTQDSKLKAAVGQLWGTKQYQSAPSVSYQTARKVAVDTYNKAGKSVTDTKLEYTKHPVPLDASDLNVDLKLDHRRKGLLWYSTYRVAFAGKYRILNNTGAARDLTFNFTFPSQTGVYDDFRLVVGDKKIKDIQVASGQVTQKLKLAPGQAEDVRISYSSQGMDEWWYAFGSEVSQVRNFSLAMHTNFGKIDFPQNSMSPTWRARSGGGWDLKWQYTSLLSGVQIGMAMPKKLNPGPWVGKITYFAPVSLFFFFFLLLVFTTLRHVKLHPMHFFFLAAAFFSFHLLLAYLVDHISIAAGFWICAAVSIFLVVSYMRMVVGVRFAMLEVGLSQLVYLVGFSYTFFFEQYTGLAVTVLSVITLFIVMQMTGRVDWDKVFRGNGEGVDEPPRTLQG